LVGQTSGFDSQIWIDAQRTLAGGEGINIIEVIPGESVFIKTDAVNDGLGFGISGIFVGESATKKIKGRHINPIGFNIY